MAEDVKHAMGKMSRVLRVAKDRAQAQFGKAKEMAQRISRGSPSGQQPSATFPAPGGEQKVQQLMALGFSAVAARQSLRVCGGDIELASAWLLDERNADEIMAAEFAAAEANRGLAAGNSAQIHGLRSAPELNGRVVQLYKWDEATQRWIVSLPDGSVKSIRAQNLDPLDLPSGPRPQAQAPQAQAPRPAQAPSYANVRGEAVPAAPRQSPDLEREELKSLAREMLASSGGEQASDEVLNALSVDDLLELVTTLQIDGSAGREGADVTASAGYPPGYHSESEVPAASQPPSHASFARSTSPADPAAASAQRVDLESERERLELEEARLQSLAEAQTQRAKELEAREEALREAEERLEKRRAEVDAEKEEKKEAPVRIPFVMPEAEMSPTTQAAQEVEAERAELQRLREEVEAAAKEMELRQQAAKQRAEERELQFLEEESAQMQMASTLKEEEARLEMQRRSLGMLQQALFKGATAPTQNGYMEHSLNDGDQEGARGYGEAACAGKAALSDDESEAGDEVWDLDWSAVNAKDGATEPKAAGSSEPASTGGAA